MQEISVQQLGLLEELTIAGVKLRVVDDALQFQGNGYLGGDLRQRLLENKPGLIKLLRLKEHRGVRVGKWNFSLQRIPSQEFPGAVDVWMCGQRVDKQGHQFWFVGREDPPHEPQG